MKIQSMSKSPHHGRNIRRMREILGIKQEALAWELGADWSQKKVSVIEQKAHIPDEILQRFAQVLKVPITTLQTFEESHFLNLLQNEIPSKPSLPSSPSVPLEKWLYALEEIESLYERLLKSEQEKVALLQKMLDYCLKPTE